MKIIKKKIITHQHAYTHFTFTYYHSVKLVAGCQPTAWALRFRIRKLDSENTFMTNAKANRLFLSLVSCVM